MWSTVTGEKTSRLSEVFLLLFLVNRTHSPRVGSLMADKSSPSTETKTAYQRRRPPSPASARGLKSTMVNSARSSSPLTSRSMSSSASGPIPISSRPKWDDTPQRARPPALRGLRSDSEPWSRDEFVYNRRAVMLSDYHGFFDIEARSPYSPHRLKMNEMRKTAYLDRWNQKFEDAAGTLNHHDGNPFT